LPESNNGSIGPWSAGRRSGFFSANLMRASHEPDNAIPNAIPRRRGRFYWRPVYNAVSAGASMLYGAMFKEANEGTAMFKLLPSTTPVPVRGIPPGTAFVTLDADGCRLPGEPVSAPRRHRHGGVAQRRSAIAGAFRCRFRPISLGPS